MYTYFFKNFLYPFYETRIQKRKTLTYLDELQTTQWLSPQETAELQWKRVRILLAHAIQNSPFYAELYHKLGISLSDIKSMDDFLLLPTVSRLDVVNNFERMHAVNFKDQLLFKATGGSTGVPVRLALDRKSYEWRTAVTQRGYSWANCDIGKHTLYIWSVDIGKQPFFKALKNSLYHSLLNRKMFNCFVFDDAEMLRCVKYINEKKPTGIVSYTTAVYNLAKFISTNNVQLDTSAVKSIITGAERLFDYQRELIESVFKAPVFNTYGCREFMLIASECEKHEGLHANTDSLVVEILVDGQPAKPGETGEVAITDLHNYGMPFIRYKNGDVATQSSKSCSCGRGLPLIENIDGRKLDLITAYNGTKVSGVFFPHLMKEVKEIKKFQVIQKSLDQIEIKMVLQNPISDEKIGFLRQQIHGVVGSEVNVSFVFVDDIPLNATGKFRVTISEIKD
ncbi:MAG: phenylacetate--CoA ligase family protein [Pseudomonadota bacterium]